MAVKFLTKLIRKTYVGNPLYLLYKKEGICVCVLEWSIFTNSIKNTALNKRLLSCETWWLDENFASLWFAQQQKHKFLRSQHSTPLTVRSALTILKCSACINRSCKKTYSCKTSFSQSVQKLFPLNIKSIDFSNPQNFLRINSCQESSSDNYKNKRYFEDNL